MKTYFGPSDSPYQFTALGTKENVKAFTAEQVRKWYSEKVLNGRRVLAVYGDIDVAAAKMLAANYLGGGKQAARHRRHVSSRFPTLDMAAPAARRST